ncbi:hypothetical protein DS6A_52 [Mycobacterium phage DS6A]|uniref:TipAS antibiotic-recognition domain-containing protein n=1 Tax=Mycobacterium phage DS6A TaxID=45764 RepID=G8I4G2_9CAUD|nr:hypothetical protein DS6A_52 [Mycobacterium phage DS6A]AER47606.1 hypothetical protein DS6A_52 [Mycobacterium phage DS6A]
MHDDDGWRERSELRRIFDAYQLVRDSRHRITEAEVGERLHELDTIALWLDAEARWRRDVEAWLAAERRWQEIGHRAATDPVFQAAAAGWDAMRRICPNLDGAHYRRFGDLSPVLQERYAAFAAGVLRWHRDDLDREEMPDGVAR